MSHLVKGLRFAALMLLCLPLRQVTRGAAQQARATVRSYGGGAVGGGPGGGVGDQLSHRARRACESKVLSTGHGSVRVDNTYQRDENVIVNARATDAGRDWNIECTYRTVLQSAVLTRVSEVGGVLQSGPGKRQSWGVQHQLGLRRAGQTYSRATCNYLSSEGRVTLAS
jgi:hypothetical protein